MSKYKLHILGSRGSHSVFGEENRIFGGQTSCYVLKGNQYAVVIDCGTGLYSATELLKDCKKIDIVLSHMHYDHVLGLLEKSVFPSEAEINFYGTFDRWDGANSIEELYRGPFWPINSFDSKVNIIANDGDLIKLSDDVSFVAYPSNHPDNTSVFCFNVNNSKIAIFSDYEYDADDDLSFIQNADILLFDGMFDNDDYSEHVGWGHSDWKSGIEVANKYNIDNLLIIHHNPMYNDYKLSKMEEDGKKYFDNIIFVKSGQVFDI